MLKITRAVLRNIIRTSSGSSVVTSGMGDISSGMV